MIKLTQTESLTSLASNIIPKMSFKILPYKIHRYILKIILIQKHCIYVSLKEISRFAAFISLSYFFHPSHSDNAFSC